MERKSDFGMIPGAVESLYVKLFQSSSIAGSKGAMAADLWVGIGGYGAWDPKFLRSFND